MVGSPPASRVSIKHPVVVSSTAHTNEVSKNAVGAQDETGRNLDNILSSPRNIAGGFDSITQQHFYQFEHQPTSPRSPLPDGDTQFPHEYLHALGSPSLQNYSAMMQGPGHSHSAPPPYPPHYRYSMAPSSSFLTAVPSNYPPQGPVPAANALTGMVYYPIPPSRYPAYHYPYVPSFNSQSMSQVSGPFFYPTAYPHSFPQTPTTTGSNTGILPNLSHPNPQSSSRWSAGQQPQYTFVTSQYQFPGPQPMQSSMSQQQPPAQQNAPAAPPQYTRRHSHPVKTSRPKVTDSEFAYAWNQGTNFVGPTGSIADQVPRGSIGVSGPPLNAGIGSPPIGRSSDAPVTTSRTTPPLSALPRGPPRKPRQSGHALWVGNLAPGTTVVELKDYFASEAKDEIESVFLISKSNCAFINYRTDTACNDAMVRFHDSRFKGVRLVCRLRRNSSTSPAPKAGGRAELDGTTEGADREEGTNADAAETVPTMERKEGTGSGSRDHLKNRIFIVKSLTVEDLDLSVKNGVWATQSHNEDVFNRAFETAENVYLIFSANKSGEYYGYARMVSKIPDDSIQDIQWSHANPSLSQASAGESLPESMLPKSIFTPATATAPHGRIIDDSARGTIFWEAIGDDSPDDSTMPKDDEDELGTVAKSWGKPFRVEWISTTKIPFYKTRGLRNAWNSNREVKIARDGTEVEESVGKRLLHMFHRGLANVASN